MSASVNQSLWRIAIVGGGVAGTALAAGLSRYSHLEVRLFESAAALGEVGAGISLGANALQALDLLGIGEAWRAVADSSPEPWQDVWFEWRYARDGEYIASTLAPGVGQSCAHRADLLNTLAAGLPAACLCTGKRAQSFIQSEDGVELSFTDGSHYYADMVIAADGIKSSMRTMLERARGAKITHPVFSGTLAWRGLVDSARLHDAFAAHHLDSHMLRVPQMFLAENAHILTFPVKKGRLINIVAFTTNPALAGQALPDNQPWVRDGSPQEMLAAFADCGVAVRCLLEGISAPTCWALHDIEPLPQYHWGRIALIGDAAHAMLPHQGAGAGQGLEDAGLLVELCRSPELLEAGVPRLLEAFANARIERAHQVQLTSRMAGDLYEFRDPIAGDDSNRLRDSLTRRFEPLWNYSLSTICARLRQELRAPQSGLVS